MGVPNTRRAQRQSSMGAEIPASILGINVVTSLSTMNPAECIYSYNIGAEDLGMTVREGNAEWANGWTGGISRTVIPFEGNVAADDKLFVANDAGIWDVTTADTTAPTQVVTFPSTAGDAGICSSVNFSNDGDERFLLVCDMENGYYRWTQSTNTWVKYTQGAGANQVDNVDPALFDYLMIWKERLWFVQEDSANAWYLPIGVYEGAAVKFNFGAQFKFGGALRSIHNWTLDGGAGIDDYLVAISGAGDVVVYQGTDPAAAATFALVGSWYVGQLPAGNRIAFEYSGEVYILSIQGLLPMSSVLNSANAKDPYTYLTAKISPYMRNVMNSAIDDFGWQVYVNPKKSKLHINSPPRTGFDQLAFSFYFGNQSWSMDRGVDKAHSANWKGDLYWTDISRNKLFKQTGGADNVYIDPTTDGQPIAVTWDILTAYQPLGNSPSTFKRAQFIRPMFSAQGVPAFTVAARYDYSIAELSGAPSYAIGGAGVWDNGDWNTATWAYGTEKSDTPRGGAGMGRHVAVIMRGVSASPTTLAAFDLTYDEGGLL